MDRVQEKRKNRQYSPKKLEKAILDVKNGLMSTWKASKHHAIPYQTLKDNLDGTFRSNQIGARPILSNEDEKELVGWIQERAKLGYPLDKLELKDAAVKIAQRRGMKNFSEKGPSRAWYDNFMAKNPQLTLRKPEGLSKASGLVTAKDIEEFLSGIKDYLNERGVMEYLNEHPENFINLDETAFEFNSKPDKVLTDKSIPHTYFREAGAHHKKITVTVTIGADGRLWTPQVIFNEGFNKISDVAFASGLEQQEYLYSTSQNGWQTSKTFQEYVIKIIEEMRNHGIEGPIILYCDGFPGHVSLDLRKYCNENDVIFVILLPNSTHLLQPLDVVIFKPVKAEFKVQSSLYKRVENKTDLTEADFIRVVSRTLKKAITVDLVKKSFATTGLFPINPVYQHQGRIVAPTHTQSSSETQLMNFSPQAVLNRVTEIEKELNSLKAIQGISFSQLATSVPTEPSEPTSQYTFFDMIASPSPPNSLFRIPSNSNSLALNDILTIPSIPNKTRKRQYKVKSHGIISTMEVINAVEEQMRTKEVEKEEAVAKKRARVEKKADALKMKKENEEKRVQMRLQKEKENAAKKEEMKLQKQEKKAAKVVKKRK